MVMYGLKRDGNENGIMHFQKSMQRRKALPVSTVKIEMAFWIFYGDLKAN